MQTFYFGHAERGASDESEQGRLRKRDCDTQKTKTYLRTLVKSPYCLQTSKRYTTGLQYHFLAHGVMDEAGDDGKQWFAWRWWDVCQPISVMHLRRTIYHEYNKQNR